MLATRLSKVLNSIIFEQQSAFIGGRILDSMVVLNEVIEEAKSNQKKKKNQCLLYKIEFAKAYG